MKKYLSALSMIAAAFAVSCTKVELEPETPVAEGDVVTIDVSLPLDATKTTLGTDGKTVTWALGDSILVTDGTKKVGVPIPEEFVGQKTAKVELSSKDLNLEVPLYAVYPYSAFDAVSKGVVTVKIRNEQSGLFNEANICVAKTEDFNFAFKNATAVMKVKLTQPDIETIMISGGAADTLASSLAVTYTTADAPLSVKASAPLKSIKVNSSGLDGDYYVAVTPGTYSENLSLMVLTLDGKTETIKSTKSHTLKANDLVFLGEVGDNLEGISFEGTGTSDDPFLIKNTVEFDNLATLVNSGLTYEGTSFKLAENIDDAQIPIGKYDAVNYYFCGEFDGDGHTVTLNMGGSESTAARLGLFGAVGPDAYIHDVKVDGTIQTKGAYVGAIAATVNGGTSIKAKIENCVNKATIVADSYVGGVSGYVSGAAEFNNCTNEGAIFGVMTSSSPTTDIKAYVGGIIGNANGSAIKILNCKNDAPVSSIYNVGGIVGFAYASTIENCTNTSFGEITGSVDCGGVYKMNQSQSGWLWGNLQTAWAGGTPYNVNNSLRGVGGIAGCGQNAIINNCVNNAAVQGISKVGGIVGSSYGANTTACVNTGSVTASETMAGGIIGWVYTVASSKNDSNSGAVSGKFAVGGLIGLANTLGYSSGPATSNILNGTNTGSVSATAKYNFVWGVSLSGYSCAGGIVGLALPQGQASDRRGYINIKTCENKADITGAGSAVGGIVGATYGTQYSLTNSVVSCVNSGNVTGAKYVGGVIGESYANKSGHYKFIFSNLFNSGTVTATVDEENATSYAGGIIGASVYGSFQSGTTASYGAQLTNSLNTGDVIYTSESAKNPRVGGIIGSTSLGVVNNVYSVGAVSPVSGEMPGEDVVSFAGVIGCISDYATATSLYFLESTAELAVGSASTVVPAVSSMVDEEDGLYTPATISGTQYDNVINALNAWVAAVPQDFNKNNHYTWAAGPVFVK